MLLNDCAYTIIQDKKLSYSKLERSISRWRMSNLDRRIQELREVLNETYTNTFDKEIVLEISQYLDVLIVEYMKAAEKVR